MPAKHWSTNVNQVTVQRGSNGSFNLCIEGGSEYGQFVVIGDVLTGNYFTVQIYRQKVIVRNKTF